MNILKFLSSNKVLTLIITIVISIFTTGVVGRKLINSKISNWSENTSQYVEDIEISAKQIINYRQDRLLLTKDNLRDELSSLGKVNYNLFNDIISNKNNENLKIAIFQNDELFYWNKYFIEQITIVDSLLHDFGETYFLESDINSYLVVRDTFKVGENEFQLYVAEIIEKQYQLNETYFHEISLTKDIIAELNTDFWFDFSPEANKSKDGRKHSFDILNNKENKIGVATFLKPSREFAASQLEESISSIQGILALLGYLLMGFYLWKELSKNTKRFIEVFAVTIYLIALRYLLVFLRFPQKLFSSELLNDKYYYSSFGSGLANSPIDLFITLLFVFILMTFYFQSTLRYLKHKNQKPLGSFIFPFLVLIIGILLYIVALRGAGAAIRGFVFDTSLRYFQSASLTLTTPHFLMHVNVLLLGLASLLGSIIIIILISVIFKRKSINLDYKFYTAIFLLFVIAEIIYTISQVNPQLNITIKIIHLFLVFFISYLFTKYEIFHLTKTILVYVSASIFSISALLFYNTELEKASLKTTASIISRVDDNWYKTLITETLLSDFSRKEAVNAFSKKTANFNASAFKIWSSSKLQKESINSSVNLFSLTGDLLGGFGSIYPKISLNRIIDTNSVIEEIQIFEEPLENDSQKLIRGIFPVKDDYAFLGYLDVSILFDLNDFGFSNHPDFISTGKLNENAILKLDKLIIMDYRDNELKVVYGNLNPNQKINQTILDAEFKDNNDAWLDTEFNGYEYIVYVKKSDFNNIERIIAVALREKELSIGLFDFFKIFFSHALILIIMVIIYLAAIFRKEFKYQYNLRTQLLTAFLIISLIPLILTAFYFRNLTAEKNNDAIYYKLGKRAFSVENYLNDNMNNGFLRDLYNKATNDLNINFTLYKRNTVEYSSHDLLYDVGLLPKILNPIAYSELILGGSQEVLVTEEVDDFEFNAFYYKANLFGEETIIKIADGFNKIQLPLTGSEADVFLFGIYSLAVVIIIIFSAIFANQISLPIRKITSATKSIAAGDLSLEINTTAKGELSELVSGFHYMVRELKKNQTLIAEIEREEAWKEMAKQVAHEIKNPLTPMKLSVQQLIAAYNDKSDKFDNFFIKVTNTILNQIETLRNIATEFSNFARMPKLKLENFNLSEIIRESINLFTDEKIKVLFESDNDDTLISGDPEQLKRTIINLIRNSIQAEANEIKFDFKTTANEIELRVIDNGKGINKEDFEKIFEPNFTTKKDGMGLGLSMARRYLKSTGAEINVDYSSVDGTVIKLTFPKLV